jgi:hypothetical protein
MEFTYYNDLSLEFLAPRLLDHQRRLINFANAASEELKGDYEARRILGNLLASLRTYGALVRHRHRGSAYRAHGWSRRQGSRARHKSRNAGGSPRAARAERRND